MRAVRQWLYRLVVFNAGMRKELLQSIAAQLVAGNALLDVFRLLQAYTADHTLRRVADVTLSSIQAGQPFAARYEQEGFFSARQAKLLIAGERNNTLPAVIELMTKGQADNQSWAGVVLYGNAQWILAFVMMVAVTLYGPEFEQMMTFGSGPPASFFVLAHWLRDTWIWFVLAAVLAVWGYYFARERIHGHQRRRCRAFGVFLAHDMAAIAEVSELLAALFRGGCAQAEALSICRSVFARSGHKGYLETALQRAADAMRSGPLLVPALGTHLLDEAATARLMLQAPRQTPAELAKALSQYGETARSGVARALRVQAGLVATATAATAFALFIPLINLLLGANMNAQF